MTIRLNIVTLSRKLKKIMKNKSFVPKGKTVNRKYSKVKGLKKEKREGKNESRININDYAAESSHSKTKINYKELYNKKADTVKAETYFIGKKRGFFVLTENAGIFTKGQCVMINETNSLTKAFATSSDGRTCFIETGTYKPMRFDSKSYPFYFK